MFGRGFGVSVYKDGERKNNYSMKKCLVLVLLVLTVFSLGAVTYHVGISAGGDLNFVVAGKGYRDYRYGAKVGFTGGIDFVLDFTKHLSLESGITYMNKNYSYKRSTSGVTTVDYRVSNGYLLLPVEMRVTIPLPAKVEKTVENEDGTVSTVTEKGESDFSLFLSGGGFVGVWLYGKRSGTVMGITGKESVDELTDLSVYNQFDAGFLVSLGVSMDIGKIDCYAKLGYMQSLTDMNKKQTYGSYPIHNSSVSLTLGALWGINK